MITTFTVIPLPSHSVSNCEPITKHDLALSLWHGANTINRNYSNVEFLGVVPIFAPKNT